AEVSFDWQTGYPATINDAAAVDVARATVSTHFGEDQMIELATPLMGSEDFSFLLEKVPGAYVLIGNGDSSGLHTTTYDFNDAILERGAKYFYYLAKDSLV
ncbi:M20/M25/M40 family metallo-hydrolase, partial [Rhizobium sp. KVB221]